jgi:hypothetical protein
MHADVWGLHGASWVRKLAAVVVWHSPSAMCVDIIKCVYLRTSAASAAVWGVCCAFATHPGTAACCLEHVLKKGMASGCAMYAMLGACGAVLSAKLLAAMHAMLVVRCAQQQWRALVLRESRNMHTHFRFQVVYTLYGHVH